MKDILLTFDTETTSADPKTTRVVQVAAIATCLNTGNKEVVVNTLCNPGVSISDSAAEVHGISDEHVKDKRPDSEVMYELATWIKERESRILLGGHNLKSFDIPILWRVAGVSKVSVPSVDTLVCATRTLPQAANHKLGELVVSLGLGSNENAHDALADIEMVNKLIEYFTKGLGMSVVELAEWCSQARVLTTCHFGKFKGRKWGKPLPGENKDIYVPYGYARFIADNFDSLTPDMAATLYKHYNIRVSESQVIKD